MKSVKPPTQLPAIRRLSEREVERVHPDLLEAIHRNAWSSDSLQPITPLVLGSYHLARGSVFYAAPEVTEPFLFVSRLPGRLGQDTHEGRAYIVVAREYGDLSWPAWLAGQRRQARGDARVAVNRRLGHVKDWLTPGWRASHAQGRTAA